MEISISVRSLVEFLMRSGDIDNRRSASPEDAMQEGSRIHRMLQKRAGSDYQAEVILQYQYRTENYTIDIAGRADGIIGGMTADLIAEEEFFFNQNDDEFQPVVIDEIKGVYKDLHRIQEPVSVHLAQAKCYAYFYAIQNQMPRIRVRMTYCHLETEELRYFFYEYTVEELQKWFEDMMQQYQKWADYTYDWSAIRQNTIKELTFPFPYREGQKQLISYVYQTIYHKKKLFIEAPTGVGKTISTVFPAVKAVGEGLAGKVFYLTAKTITRTVAEEAFTVLREQGLSFKTVIITAKEKICFQDEVNCNPLDCPYAKGHFDRINDAIYDLLTHEAGFTRELIEEYAIRHQVCPFEMCLDMSLFADGIICDYNYVFDPHVYLRRFFGEGSSKGEYLFLIDEAHNLLDRGREMYSATLKKEDFLTLKKIVYDVEPKMGRALERCNKEMLALKKECEDYIELDSIEALVVTINRLSSLLEKYLEEHTESPIREDVLNFYFAISHFLLIYDKLDENYIIYSEMEPDGSFIVKLFCVNPSVNLKECMQRGRSSVLFSATLLPIQYYKKLLGGEETDYEVYAESVFDSEKRHLIISEDVTSKYTRRGPREYNKIASYIKAITKEKKGNYMIFFPSHAFLQSVYDIYQSSYEEKEIEDCILQEEYMDEESREKFLQRFAEDKIDEYADRTLIGFCVLGGIFSEGIDLKNDSLIGAIIVGTGFPQVCNEREMMSGFFAEEDGQGFYYAYQYPGMNKVAQAAGRVIRTVKDVGVVALLDERFLQTNYQKMFPKEWNRYYRVSLDNVSENVKKFWETRRNDLESQ